MESTSGSGLLSVACAECRRSKTKCNRRAPCDHCIKKGCANLCPNSALVAWYKRRAPRSLQVNGQPNQSLVDATMKHYVQRIKDLERALEVSHSSQSSTSHPLLAKQLRIEMIKLPMNDEEQIPGQNGTITSPYDKEQTRTKWLDPNSVSSWLAEDDGGSAYTTDLGVMAQTYLLSGPWNNSDIARSEIESCLPPRKVMREMIDHYFSNGVLQFLPVPKPLVDRTLLSVPPSNLTRSQLAQLLFLLALAVQHAPTNPPPPEWSTGPAWFEMGCEVLPLTDIWVQPTLETVEAIALQFLFLLRADCADAHGRAWGTLGVALRLAQVLNLHRDPKRWRFTPEEAQRRRRVFWELWATDMYLSLGIGRPPAISFQHFDTEMPFDTVESLGMEPAYFKMKHQMVGTIVIDIVNVTGAGPCKSTYNTILSLDERLRSAPVSNKLLRAPNPCYIPDPEDYPSTALRSQEHIFWSNRLHILILLHRPFFAKAIVDAQEAAKRESTESNLQQSQMSSQANVVNIGEGLNAGEHLMRSPYYTSVLKLFESVQSMVAHFSWLKEHEGRILQMMTEWPLQSMTCLVACAALLMKTPQCNLAMEALQSFDRVTLLILEGDGRQGLRADRLFPMISNLWYLAHESMRSVHGSIQPGPHHSVLDSLLRPYLHQHSRNSAVESPTCHFDEAAEHHSSMAPLYPQYLDPFTQLSRQLWSSTAASYEEDVYSAQVYHASPATVNAVNNDRTSRSAAALSFNDYLRLHDKQSGGTSAIFHDQPSLTRNLEDMTIEEQSKYVAMNHPMWNSHGGSQTLLKGHSAEDHVLANDGSNQLGIHMMENGGSSSVLGIGSYDAELMYAEDPWAAIIAHGRS